MARQEIAERLAELARRATAGHPTPKLSPLVRAPWTFSRSVWSRTSWIAYALRDVAEWVMKPKLLAVPGVAHVIMFGGDARRFRSCPT